LARWKRGLVGVSHAPTLAGTARFEPGWVERYLLSPSDLRPSLISTMPRLELTPDDARDIAAYLAAAEALPLHAKVRAGDAAVGRRVAESRGCATCHAFSGMSGWPNARGAGPAVELAPDLQKARERFSHDVLGSWLENPAAMKPDTLMPNLALTEAERADLVAFILEEPLEPASPSEFVRLPILERRVSYAEVDARVFSVTCRHCHSSNEVAFGDGGPGYDGGFGFAARRIDLSSHRGVSSGMLDRKGERQSLFAPTTSGKPRLLAALLVRHREERGEIDPDLRGMPLGLPALTAEQVQLVESWIAQGRPL
jgi:cytochrome c2